MNTPQDGGPAFPGIEGTPGYGFSTRSTYGEWTNHNQGMTLRDWFAGMALQGYCARPDLDKECQQGFALAAYDQADAMLAARERKETR